jgi:signal transduction histidine kinase
MAGTALDEMKRQIGFDETDAIRVRALGEILRPRFDEVVDSFYDKVTGNAEARAILIEGQAQLKRLHDKFSEWLEEVFCGVYDDAYYRKRLVIGETHVRINMPQHFMLTFMDAIWQELSRQVDETDLEDRDAYLSSLHKILSLDTAIMLESYKERYSDRIRHEERTVAEERITRSEHLAEIGQLAASLAHEIKNPLAGISGAIQVIGDAMASDDPHKEIIREILGQVKRLDGSVKDLLVYARPNPPEMTSCPIGLVVERVLRLMKGTPTFHHTDVVFEAEADVPAILADERQIEQLIMNLLVNAAHATPEAGTIRVRLKALDDMVCLTIQDPGVGMEKSVAQRAFEPFFTTKAKGTGLGLPICKKIVEAHRGTIALTSELGRGTVVVVALPREQPARSAKRETAS